MILEVSMVIWQDSHKRHHYSSGNYVDLSDELANVSDHHAGFVEKKYVDTSVLVDGMCVYLAKYRYQVFKVIIPPVDRM